MTILSGLDLAFLNDLMRGKRVTGSDRDEDRSRQRMRRLGLAFFDREEWRWQITDAGREAYRTGVSRPEDRK